MRDSCNLVVRLGLCGFTLLISAIIAHSSPSKVYRLGNDYYPGNGFDDAMSDKPRHCIWYPSTAPMGYKCPDKRFYNEDGHLPDGWRHGDSFGGYLVPVTDRSFFKVSTSWNGIFTTNMIYYTCAQCFAPPKEGGFMQLPIIEYNQPESGPALPPWIWNSPYVRNIQVTTDGGGASGSTITGGSFDVVPPAGFTADDGEFNDYDFNTPAQFNFYPGHEPEGTLPPVYEGDAWTAQNVGMQLQHSAASRNSLANIDTGVSGLLSQESAGWAWLRNQSFNPEVNVNPEITLEPEIIINPTVTVTPDVSVTVQGGGAPVDFSGVISAVNDLESEVLQRLDDALDVDVSESDFPAIPDDDQAVLDAAHEADLTAKVTAIETEVQKIDLIMQEIVSSFGGLMGSLVGSWEGLGRSKPTLQLAVAIPLLDAWNMTIDLDPYEDLISFFRAFSAVMLFLGFLFAVYRLMLGLGV